MKRPYTIVYEDEAVVVVNKAAGLLTIPDRYIAEKPNLQQMLASRYDKIWTIHRLDRTTSGLLIFAKDEETHRHLSQQFEQQQTDKIYWALVNGQVASSSGEINHAIAPSKTRSGQMMISNHGKEARTSWQLLEVFRHFSLLEVKIHTGRTHQIRVHLEAIGHPLAADAMYGRSEPVFLSSIKKRKAYRRAKDFVERPLLERPGLHAYQLRLTHPVTEQKMSWTVEPPKDLRALLNQLRKWDQV